MNIVGNQTSLNFMLNAASTNRPWKADASPSSSLLMELSLLVSDFSVFTEYIDIYVYKIVKNILSPILG